MNRIKTVEYYFHVKFSEKYFEIWYSRHLEKYNIKEKKCFNMDRIACSCFGDLKFITVEVLYA